jgi:hypothetical protein
MDGSFIDSIIGNLMPQEVEHHGLPYVISGNGQVKMINPPHPQRVSVFSLAPFLAMVAQVEGVKVIVNVVDHTKVVAFLRDLAPDGVCEEIVSADFSKSFEPFESGIHHDQETFITKLQSMFYPSLERDDLMKLVGSVRKDSESVNSDDGVTQNLQAKAGVHLSKEVKVRNPWYLSPFKSFPEIPPVEIPHVLRVGQGRNGVGFALYEADGARWKVETTHLIREYLRTQFLSLKAEHVTVL